MKIHRLDTTFGREGTNTGYMILTLVCAALTACFPSAGIPVWRYDQADRLVDEGVVALREGRLADAETAFDLARDYAPLAAALDGKGCVAFQRGDFAQAEELFREAYESDGTYDDALGNLALVLDVVGRDQEALDLYQLLLEQHPEAARQRNNRAALAFESGKTYVEVEAELAKAALDMNGGPLEKNLEIIRQAGGRRYDKESN
jgi:tetratricopeptide (TPR) repeat protein